MPNSVFVDTMVTNMDRITHRRFEASFSLRYQVRRSGLMTSLASFWCLLCLLKRTYTHPPHQSLDPHTDNQDFETLPEVILEIKKALRVLPKVYNGFRSTHKA